MQNVSDLFYRKTFLYGETLVFIGIRFISTTYHYYCMYYNFDKLPLNLFIILLLINCLRNENKLFSVIDISIDGIIIISFIYQFTFLIIV